MAMIIRQESASSCQSRSNSLDMVSPSVNSIIFIRIPFV